MDEKSEDAKGTTSGKVQATVAPQVKLPEAKGHSGQDGVSGGLGIQPLLDKLKINMLPSLVVQTGRSFSTQATQTTFHTEVGSTQTEALTTVEGGTQTDGPTTTGAATQTTLTSGALQKVHQMCVDVSGQLAALMSPVDVSQVASPVTPSGSVTLSAPSPQEGLKRSGGSTSGWVPSTEVDVVYLSDDSNPRVALPKSLVLSSDSSSSSSSDSSSSSGESGSDTEDTDATQKF